MYEYLVVFGFDSALRSVHEFSKKKAWAAANMLTIPGTHMHRDLRFRLSFCLICHCLAQGEFSHPVYCDGIRAQSQTQCVRVEAYLGGQTNEVRPGKTLGILELIGWPPTENFGSICCMDVGIVAEEQQAYSSCRTLRSA